MEWTRTWAGRWALAGYLFVGMAALGARELRADSASFTPCAADADVGKCCDGEISPGGTGYNVGRGTCQKGQCSRPTGDGTTVTYDCLRCLAEDGGVPASGTSCPVKSDDGGCSLSVSSASQDQTAWLWLLLPLAALGRYRLGKQSRGR